VRLARTASKAAHVRWPTSARATGTAPGERDRQHVRAHVPGSASLLHKARARCTRRSHTSPHHLRELDQQVEGALGEP
jgi:hypothetical protein